MFEYYHNNYLKTFDTGSTWKLEFNPCTEIPKDFYHEAIRTAKLIYEKSKKDIYCFVSGGRDSLYMSKAFLDSKVPFKIAIMSWGDLNNHDIKHAIDFSKTYNIKYEIINLDIIEFIESGEHKTLSETIGTWTHQIAPIVKAVESVDSTVVLGNGDPMFIPANLFDYVKWYYFDHQILNSMNKYFEKKKLSVISEFYRYTPEIFASFIKDGNIKTLVNECKNYDTIEWRKAKYKLYEDNFSLKFDFPKYDGWETIVTTYPTIVNKCISDIDYLKNTVSGEYLRSYKHLLQDLQPNV